VSLDFRGEELPDFQVLLKRGEAENVTNRERFAFIRTVAPEGLLGVNVMNWLACGCVLVLVLILLLPVLVDCYGYIAYERLSLQEKRARYGYLLGEERDAWLEKLRRSRKRVQWLREVKRKLAKMCVVVWR